MSPVPCTSCHHQAPVQWQCRAMSLHQIRPGLDKSIIPARELQQNSLRFLSIQSTDDTEYGEQTIYTNDLLTKYTYFNLMHPLH